MRRDPRLRTGPARRSAPAAAAPGARRWICRTPTRPPAPASRLRRARSSPRPPRAPCRARGKTGRRGPRNASPGARLSGAGSKRGAPARGLLGIRYFGIRYVRKRRLLPAAALDRERAARLEAAAAARRERMGHLALDRREARLLEVQPGD